MASSFAFVRSLLVVVFVAGAFGLGARVWLGRPRLQLHGQGILELGTFPLLNHFSYADVLNDRFSCPHSHSRL